MDFINQYFIETLVFIVVITLVIIIAILKKPTATKTQEKKKAKEVFEVVEDAFDKEEVTDEVIDEEIILEIEPEPQVQTKKRTKRELVPHDKITKDDFSIFNGVRILIAEDNFINQKVITGLLSDSGIEIIMANDGQECLNILKDDTNFSLILMDAHMPIIDGFQATRHIRKTPEYEHLPVIALSGDTAADDIRNMLNVGMEDHLEKPLRMDPLYDILYMYTNGNETNTKTKEESVEFDINQGIEICGGDKEFYLEILNEFMDNYSDSANNIKKYLNENNSKDADKLLLDISGIAANIGAEDLHNSALELKASIASPDDMAYIDSLKNFKRTLTHITQLIQEYIQTK